MNNLKQHLVGNGWFSYTWSYILEMLEKFELPLDCMMPQGYNGALVMSGSCLGVQKCIQDAAPQAVYVHCFAHTVNSVLVDSARVIP